MQSSRSARTETPPFREEASPFPPSPAPAPTPQGEESWMVPWAPGRKQRVGWGGYDRSPFWFQESRI